MAVLFSPLVFFSGWLYFFPLPPLPFASFPPYFSSILPFLSLFFLPLFLLSYLILFSLPLFLPFLYVSHFFSFSPPFLSFFYLLSFFLILLLPSYTLVFPLFFSFLLSHLRSSFFPHLVVSLFFLPVSLPESSLTSVWFSARPLSFSP